MWLITVVAARKKESRIHHIVVLATALLVALCWLCHTSTLVLALLQSSAAGACSLPYEVYASRASDLQNLNL